MIPIPMSASKIIETSFAPSPIERVVLVGSFFLTIQQKSAFYEGEIQQAITASIVLATVIKQYSSFLFV